MRRYGLLGFPLSHSFSADYFANKFDLEGIDATYQNFDLPSIDLLPTLLKEHPDLAGLNVTIPYKQAVISYLDALDKETEAIGAVNVIHFQRDSKGRAFLTGYNSDLVGFRESIRPLIEQLKGRLRTTGVQQPQKLKALILGTGGASKAVCYGLHQLDIDTLFVSRSSHSGGVVYDQLTPFYYSDYQIIVNTTPLGMFPNVDSFPPLDYNMIGTGHLLFDAVYNPLKTRFLEYGEERGALIENGLDMLYRQAEAAWNIWNA